MKLFYINAALKELIHNYFFKCILSMRVIHVLFIYNNSKIEAKELTNDAVVSIVICAPSNQNLLTSFGHCAIHIKDETNLLNKVYHYGVMNFSDLNFYTYLTNQRTKGRFATQSYTSFALQYSFFKRQIKEYDLTLTLMQKQKIFDYLSMNTQLDTQEYDYQYFTNNCATKLRDILITCLGKDIQFDPNNLTIAHSYRSAIKPYVHTSPWTELGIDLVLGLSFEKVLTTEEKMFLPLLFLNILSTSQVKSGNHNIYLLNQSENFDFAIAQYAEDTIRHPNFILMLIGITIVGISVWDIKRRKISIWLDSLLLSVTGFIGLILGIIWVVNYPSISSFNMNLFWALPTNLFIALFPTIIRLQYLQGLFITSVLLLILWNCLPQNFNSALIPVIIGLAIRYYAQLRVSSPKENSM